jgi:hypothetical protein
MGLVSRVTPVHTAMRNCTRDEGRSFASRALFEVGSRDPSRLGRESREIWGIAESWMDEQEFQVAKSNADKCFSAALA